MKYFLLAACASTLATGAGATTTLFDLGVAHDNLGFSHTYTVGGLSLVATGYDNLGNKTALYGKHSGGNEVGLGLVNDPTGDFEIAYNHGFVQLDVSQLVGKVDLHKFKFATNSTTNGEEWGVYASNTAGSYSGGALITGVTQSTQVLTDLVGHRYYDFVEINHTAHQGDNFLLTSFSVTAVPEPSAWAMMLTGMFGIGAVARMRSLSRVARVVARRTSSSIG